MIKKKSGRKREVIRRKKKRKGNFHFLEEIDAFRENKLFPKEGKFVSLVKELKM